jgi:hypothetical protein
VQGIEVCGVQALSLVRELSFERGSAGLLAPPLRELATLRNATLLNVSAPLPARPNQPYVLALPPGTGTAVDIEAALSIPKTAAALVTSIRVFAPPPAAAATSDGRAPPRRNRTNSNLRAGNIGVVQLPTDISDAAGQLNCSTECAHRPACAVRSAAAAALN